MKIQKKIWGGGVGGSVGGVGLGGVRVDMNEEFKKKIWGGVRWGGGGGGGGR